MEQSSFRPCAQLGLAMGALLAALLLTGCSAPTVKPAPTADPGVSGSEVLTYIYDCLTEKGWDVTLTWDGIEAGSDTIPDAQRDVYEADNAACLAEVDDYATSLQPEQIAEVYDRELATRDCLIGLGYEVGQPPSEQEFIDTYYGQRWTAYGDTDAVYPGQDDTQWRQINEACPQPAWSLPPGFTP